MIAPSTLIRKIGQAEVSVAAPFINLIGPARSANASIPNPRSNANASADSAQTKGPIEGQVWPGTQVRSADQPATAAAASNAPTVPRPPAQPDWLTQDGAIKYDSISYKEILERLVMTEDLGEALLKDYAESFCEENFEEYDIFDSSDPYYTLKDLGRQDIVIDYDHQDLMDNAREACVEQRDDFFESTLAPTLVECIKRYRSDRGTFSLDGAFDELKEMYDAELRGWALQIMEDTALKA